MLLLLMMFKREVVSCYKDSCTHSNEYSKRVEIYDCEYEECREGFSFSFSERHLIHEQFCNVWVKANYCDVLNECEHRVYDMNGTQILRNRCFCNDYLHLIRNILDAIESQRNTDEHLSDILYYEFTHQHTKYNDDLCTNLDAIEAHVRSVEDAGYVSCSSNSSDED